MAFNLKTDVSRYSEADIVQAVEDYAYHHEVAMSDVLIDRRYDGGVVVGFRLSLDADGRSRGCDETWGAY